MASAAVQTPQGHAPTFASQPPSQALPKGERPHHVETTLFYHKDTEDGGPPAPSYVGMPETYERQNTPASVTVADISGSEDKYTLDGNGFQLYHHESKEKTFDDEERIKSAYYPETEKLLKDATGASRVFIFDHTIRRRTPKTEISDQRGPVRRVHIDQSYEASKNRVSYHLGDDAARLLQGRYQIINVWRPIKTIYKDPLAVADALSVPDSDLVAIPLIYPNRRGETYGVRFSDEHKWYYRYAQSPDQVTLIKCFDSKTDGRARRAPHSAFVNPETEGREERESIEVRALVFHPEDTE